MDFDNNNNNTRPHFRTTSIGTSSSSSTNTGSELFICFTSRHSSSMKLTKSLLSPGRAARDGGASLSASLSRRLRPNSSTKGQSSPFFTTSNKKKISGFENPEPSSPKVTCIGQVRVKTKKKVGISKRDNNSFRKVENQRWVHLPVSICEALKSFGACKGGACFSRQKSEKESNGSCGFTRWLVSVNDGGGRRREIELVVGGGEERRVSMRSSRRHVFEDVVIDEEEEIVANDDVEPARVSVCVPPKNALLLMRCRSDPMKMAALAGRFSWDAHGGGAGLRDDGDLVVEEENDVEVKDEIFMVEEGEESINDEVELVEESGDFEEENRENGEEMVEEENVQEVEAMNGDLLVAEEEEEVESNMSSFEELLDQENAVESYRHYPIQEKEEEIESNPIPNLPNSVTEGDGEGEEEEENVSNNRFPELHEEELTIEKENEEEETEESTTTTADDNHTKFEENHEKLRQEDDEQAYIEQQQTTTTLPLPPLESQPENQEQIIRTKKEKEAPILPDCLLLMMCEPKLSMEVSKETWVCTTDFVRWLPERPAKPAAKPEPVKRRLSTDSKPKPQLKENKNQPQPRRSSCSLPPVGPGASMASIIEHKLAKAAAYEPLGLTRCKSEPMRTAAAKLLPESCLWKNAVQKLDPHRVGAAGVGF